MLLLDLISNNIISTLQYNWYVYIQIIYACTPSSGLIGMFWHVATCAHEEARTQDPLHGHGGTQGTKPQITESLWIHTLRE